MKLASSGRPANSYSARQLHKSQNENTVSNAGERNNNGAPERHPFAPNVQNQGALSIERIIWIFTQKIIISPTNRTTCVASVRSSDDRASIPSGRKQETRG